MAPLSLLLSLAALCSAADRKTTTVELPTVNVVVPGANAQLPQSLLLPQTALPVAASHGVVPSLPSAAASAPKAASGAGASGNDKAAAAAHHGASVRFDALAKERVEFTKGQKDKLAQLQDILLAAAGDAAKAFDGMKDAKALSRGSTSRGTNTGEDADFDINLRLPQGWTEQRFARFMAKDGARFAAKLGQAVKARLDPTLGGLTADIEIGSPIRLNDPNSGKAFGGTVMIPVRAYNAARTVVLDADFTLTINDYVANDYPAYFASQMEEVRAVSGDAGVEKMLADIRLAKSAFKEVLRSYRPWHGGPGGVGVEQMVVQSGGFEPMMRKILEVAYDETGAARPKIQAASMWLVKSPYMAPANFLDLINLSAWEKLVQAAKNYAAAQDSGASIRLRDLARKPAPPKPAEAVLPAVDLRTKPVVVLGVETKLNMVRLRERLRGAGYGKAGVHSRRSDGGLRAFSVTVELERGADAEAGRAALAKALAAVGQVVDLPRAQRGDPFAGFDAVVQVQPSRKDDVQKAEKALKRLAGIFEAQAGVKSAVLIGSRKPGEPALVGLVLEDPSQGASVIRAVSASLKTRRKLALTAASFLQRKAPAPEPAKELAAVFSAPGQATLAMLNKFTIDGPKPVERGEAFLLAQGAMTMPAELEEAAAKERALKPAPRKEGESWTRASLLRRNGKVFVMLTDPDSDFGTAMRVQVPENLVVGIPGDALIELKLAGRQVLDARPVMHGARADIVIGRVRRQGGGLVLEPLLGEGGKPSTLYGVLPFTGEASLENKFVQAFVGRDGQGGFTASAVLDLGKELTPEIAVREIALRHGAKGYFPASVIAQTEKAAADQGTGSLALPQGFEDLRALAFVTIDPVGAGDLDDAFYIKKEDDGGYTWILATADVARYVSPGTPAFENAARLGNTFYSIDKGGVSDFPMNHPVVSKSLSSLLDGKDSYAMITKMRFDAAGKLLPEESGVTLGLVRAQGRYTYDEVAAQWKGGPALKHTEQISMARELADKLRASDETRGELSLDFDEVARVKTSDGWKAVPVEKDPVIEESHRLIAELKVYGNRVIAGLLTAILKEDGVPHISRVHPKPDRKRDDMARKDLATLGVPWPKNQTLAQYLNHLRERADVSHETKQLAQISALRSRSSAKYAVIDDAGHDGLALKSGEYDHPSAPIRRFSDMYNRALLETKLEGGDVAALYQQILADLRGLGFEDLEAFVEHLNGREQGARQMDYEVERFMDAWELSRKENQGKPLSGYVKSARVDERSGTAYIEIRLRQPPVTVQLSGRQYGRLKPLQEVRVVVESADPSKGFVKARLE